MRPRTIALLITSILAATPHLASAQSGTPDSSQQQSLSVPSGPKSVSFDAAPSGDSTSAPVEVAISDGSGKALAKITLTPKKKNPQQADSETVWEVSYSVGNGAPQPTGVSLPAGQLTTFSAIFTSQGISIRFGPSGEPSSFSSEPTKPPGFDLNFTTLAVSFNTGGVEVDGIRTSASPQASSERQSTAEPDIITKPVLSPP